MVVKVTAIVYSHQKLQVPKMQVLNFRRQIWGWGFLYMNLSLHRWVFLRFRYLKSLMLAYMVRSIYLWVGYFTSNWNPLNPGSGQFLKAKHVAITLRFNIESQTRYHFGRLFGWMTNTGKTIFNFDFMEVLDPQKKGLVCLQRDFDVFCIWFSGHRWSVN